MVDKVAIFGLNLSVKIGCTDFKCFWTKSKKTKRVKAWHQAVSGIALSFFPQKIKSLTDEFDNFNLSDDPNSLHMWSRNAHQHCYSIG